MMGDGETAPLWALLGDILGSDSFTEANADHCWQTFFNSGSAWATEFQSEIARLKSPPRECPRGSRTNRRPRLQGHL